MRQVSIYNLTRPELQPLEVRYCQSFFCRLRGLTFRRFLAENDGLLFVGERESRVDASIHMLFVWFDIGVVWMDSAARVVDKCIARSWRLAYIPAAPAKYILEIHPRMLEYFRKGEQTRIEMMG